ncbi:MAG: hypothetical protein Q9224_004866, partial [Gallowayella concinna]
MATPQGQPQSNSPSLDTLDMDQYINYDPSSVISNPSYTPETSQSKSIPTPSFEPIDYASSLLLTQPHPQTFAGPSHQYENYKQQTGLPLGALATTLAINENDHIVYGQAQRMFNIPSADAYYGMNTTEDLFDFNTAPLQTPAIDMDIDFSASIQDVTSDYINPDAVGGEESSFNSMPPKQRAWPGMHQQQAAMAKAQAEAQQQQRQQTLAQQQPTGSASKLSSQRPLGGAPPAKDPIVEERISRLLNQMRHSSVASSTSDAATPTAHGSASQLGRAKKDEEDMDEDERLLASEEGKKLSSKERRQLRNKVSARAFRSRRKEYIGQLEGEIAAKTAEAEELLAKNQALMSENTRLTDLTRMLLESPAFSTFLDHMSGTDKQTSTETRQEEPAPKTEEPQQNAPKDVNPHQVHNEQDDAQVGMAMMPEPYINLNTGNTGWAENMDYGLYDAQVYAVTSMPEGPAVDHLDAGSLSGKSSSFLEPFASERCKQDGPMIEFPSPPTCGFKKQMQHAEELGESSSKVDESDPAFALYNDKVSEASTSSSTNLANDAEFDCLESRSVDAVPECDQVDTAAIEKFRIGTRPSSATVERNHHVDIRPDHAHHPPSIAPLPSPALPASSFPRAHRLQEAKPFSHFLTDNFHRQHTYLRISVTERCNLRCTYCMPAAGVPLSPSNHLLTTSEIVHLSDLFVKEGVDKIRLTGGEPTVRKDIVPLMQQIGSLRSKGLKELCLTTNGISLHRKLDAMAEAGLTGVNLSLDTLDPHQFQIMTRRKGFDAVMRSLDTILEMNRLGAGIKLKINTVMMRGVNEREIIPFVEMGQEHDMEVRFIEYMPFDGNKWSRQKMLSYKEMVEIIRHKYPGLSKVQDLDKSETSKTWQVPGFRGKVGFITSMTENFCGTCNRLRITADGNLKVCLFGNNEVNLRDLLREDTGGEPGNWEALEAMKQLEKNRRQGIDG